MRLCLSKISHKKNIFELKWNFYFVLQIAHLKVGLKNPLIKKAEAFLMNLSLNDEARVV